MLIATSVLKFCLGTNFVTPYTIHHTYRHLDHNTSSWPKGPRANKKQHILVNFELWYKCRYSIQYSFQRGIRWFNQIFSILNNYVTVWGPIWHKNSKKLPISQFFLAISHLFSHLFQKYFFALQFAYLNATRIYMYSTDFAFKISI